MTTQLLTIDAGNTRSKWAVFDSAATIIEQGVFFNREIHQTQPPAAWQGCRKAVIANVAGKDYAAQLNTLCQQARLTTDFVIATDCTGNLKNHYHPPAQLGVDRWAAAVAAWQQFAQSCLIINAGTAITIDIVHADADGGAFLGGCILPGIRLMQQSLAGNTGNLNVALAQGRYQPAPNNTVDAIYSGVLNSVTGAIEKMIRVNALQAIPTIIFSGGDAALIMQHWATIQPTAHAMHARYDSTLVLKGLYFIGG